MLARGAVAASRGWVNWSRLHPMSVARESKIMIVEIELGR
jgi:hypothetical protein